MDASMLAQNVSALLIPFLPYLLNAGVTAAEEAVKRFGQDAYDGVKALWARLAPRLLAEPATEPATRKVAEHPDDEDELLIFRTRLKQLLASDLALAQDVERLLKGGALQRVLAEGGSTVRRVRQHAAGRKGVTQEAEAKDHSRLEDIDQSVQ